MTSKSKMMSFRLSAQNADTLASLSKELHISKSSILNDLLNKHLQTKQNLKLLHFCAKNSDEAYQIIKVALSKKEYLALKTLATNSIVGSVPKLIKFHALNMIYDSKILDNKEIEALAHTRAELNKIGSNINQIARSLNMQNEYKADMELLQMLESLNTILIQLSSDIKNLCASSQRLCK
ncbi:plasmid mobilization relaxosome protein MobC [uncultured Helicobacter sp.]|uniref:plasmid mobilization relaxosome protein MobC n=1 Tax=uncultured Helicobacter sp. TaxID=175537 RepID=UPI003751A73C